MKDPCFARPIAAAVLVLALCLVPLSGGAAVPALINYQGMLTDPAGAPVNGDRDFTFCLYYDAAGASPTGWCEPHTLTVADGVYSAALGSSTPLSPLPFDVPYFLGIAVAPDPEMLPRLPLTSVPYALRAARADEAAIADDTVLFGGQAPSFYQARVTGSCPPGSSVRTVNANGTVVCEEDTQLSESAVENFITNGSLTGSVAVTGDLSAASFGATAAGTYVNAPAPGFSFGVIGNAYIGSAPPSFASPPYVLEIAGGVNVIGDGATGLNVEQGVTNLSGPEGSWALYSNGPSYLGSPGPGIPPIITPDPTLALQVGGGTIMEGLGMPHALQVMGDVLVMGSDSGPGFFALDIMMGDVHIERDLYVDGLIYGALFGPSDLGWKKNVHTLESPLDRVMNLRGVSYDWRRDEYPGKNFPDGPQVGLIAQEVEKVVPEVVHTDREGYKSVSYSQLTALLVEAVKEQQRQIAALQSEVAELKSSGGNQLASAADGGANE